MLEVIDFSKKYRNNKNYSAQHINFSVSVGEVVGLVGSNGAGKSTIIKSIIGVLPFTEGKIVIGGFDLAKQPEKAKKLVGYVPDDHSVYEKLTGREYINYIGSLYGATKAQKQYIVTELAERFEISHALDQQIAGYSHGMRQKICILGALTHDPKLWILDEPMVGLDHQTMNLLCDFIRTYAADKKHAVLFSSHNLEVVRNTCDKVVFIRRGQVANIVDLRVEKDFDLNKYYTELNAPKEEEEPKEPAPAEVPAEAKKAASHHEAPKAAPKTAPDGSPKRGPKGKAPKRGPKGGGKHNG